MADNDSITTNQAPTDRPEFNASDINNAANDGPPDFHRNIQPIYEEEGEQPHLSQTDFSEKEANQNTAQNPVNDSNSVDTNAPVNNTDSSKKMSIGDALGRVSKDKDLQKKEREAIDAQSANDAPKAKEMDATTNKLQAAATKRAAVKAAKEKAKEVEKNTADTANTANTANTAETNKKDSPQDAASVARDLAAKKAAEKKTADTSDTTETNKKDSPQDAATAKKDSATKKTDEKKKESKEKESEIEDEEDEEDEYEYDQDGNRILKSTTATKSTPNPWTNNKPNPNSNTKTPNNSAKNSSDNAKSNSPATPKNDAKAQNNSAATPKERCNPHTRRIKQKGCGCNQPKTRRPRTATTRRATCSTSWWWQCITCYKHRKSCQLCCWHRRICGKPDRHSWQCHQYCIYLYRRCR